MVKTQLPRAVIFDWDYTLVDVLDVIRDAVNAVRAEFGQEAWTIEDIKEHSVRPARQLFPEWYGDDWERAYDIFYNRYHKTHLEHLKPLPGADKLLRWLKELNIPSFIVSNKRGDDLLSEVKHLGWESLFAGVVGSLDAGRDKPERDPVDLALSYAGLRADDPAIWFIGDTHADVDCARTAGCTPVMVHNPEEAARLGVELSFADCHAVLKTLQTCVP
jgi:phosphoglycolate phosphatase